MILVLDCSADSVNLQLTPKYLSTTFVPNLYIYPYEQLFQSFFKRNMAPKDYLGKDQRNTGLDDKAKKEDDIQTLDAGDIHLLKTYGQVQSLTIIQTDCKPIRRVHTTSRLKRLKMIYRR